MPLTHLHPGVLSGQPYGSFAGKATDLHPVGRLTALHAGAITGRRYGSFAGRVPVVPPPPPVPSPGGGGGGGRIGGRIPWRREKPAKRPRRTPAAVVARGGVVFGPPVVRGRAVVTPAPRPAEVVPELVPVGAGAGLADDDDELAVLVAGAAMMFGGW